MDESLLRGTWNRALQLLARFSPGGRSLRVWLHRLRGVHVGRGAFIGTDALIGTSWPHLVSIGDGSVVGIRCVIIDHFRGVERRSDGPSVRIGRDAFLGPGVIVLPGTEIGDGAVVCAGSVVSRNVPPLTMVQGVPARPVARCSVPLGLGTPLAEFQCGLRPLGRAGRRRDCLE